MNKRLKEQKAYHGTNLEFDKFDLNKFQRGDYGYGIYFTHDKLYAGDYGAVNQYEIPDNEYLLSWEDTWQYQSEYVYDCLDRLFDDLYDNDRDSWEKIIEIIDRGYGNDGEGLYFNLSEILKLSSKQTSELLYKYGIKGIDSFKGNCQVIFNSEDAKQIKMNERLEIFNEFASTESVYELVDYLNKSKLILRGLYDPIKNLYLAMNASDGSHYDLFNKAWQTGWYPELIDLNERIDYYDYNLMNNTFMWTPDKEKAEKLVGFDNWNYIVNGKYGALILRNKSDKIRELISLISEEKQMSLASLTEELNKLIEDFTEEPDAFETKSEEEMDKQFQLSQDKQMQKRELLITRLYNYLRNKSWVHDITLTNNEISFIVDGDPVSQLAFRKWEGTSKILKDFVLNQYNDEETNLRIIIS